jgi:hypothetical protein
MINVKVGKYGGIPSRCAATARAQTGRAGRCGKRTKKSSMLALPKYGGDADGDGARRRLSSCRPPTEVQGACGAFCRVGVGAVAVARGPQVSRGPAH